MRTSPRGLELIKQFEGCKLKPYLDSRQIPTIGIGTCFYPDGSKVTMNDPAITMDRALALLSSHLATQEVQMNRLITVTVNQNQFDAMSSLTYNIGIGNFQKSSVLKDVNNESWDEAADAFLMWNKAGGQVSKGLTTRREAERELFLESSSASSGVFPEGPSDKDINITLEDIEKEALRQGDSGDDK